MTSKVCSSCFACWKPGLIPGSSWFPQALPEKNFIAPVRCSYWALSRCGHQNENKNRAFLLMETKIIEKKNLGRSKIEVGPLSSLLTVFLRSNKERAFLVCFKPLNKNSSNKKFYISQSCTKDTEQMGIWRLHVCSWVHYMYRHIYPSTFACVYIHMI